MPFRKWAVEPVFLCRKPLPPDKNSCEFVSVTNASLVSCLKQLASVAKIADRIFDEIGSECRMVAERAERLRAKVNSCQDVVLKLNARAVQVPVSDLSETARILRQQKPFITRYEQSTQLFLPSTRPPCVDKMYGSACTTPVAVMCTIDRYRTDGLSSSELFMVTPVLGGTRKKRRRLLDIETRKPANFSLAKTKQNFVECGTASLPSMVSPSTGYILRQNENLELERLPSPEEQAMLVSLEYPSTVVPVDTSGTSFNKMSLLRRSLIHADFVIKRKKSKRKSKRRHTFCEGENRDIEKAIRNVTNSSCQTDDLLDVTSSSSTTIHRSLSKRRSRSALDNSRRRASILDELDLDSFRQESKDSATEEDKERSPSKSSVGSTKKAKTTSSLRSRSYNFNPISSLSAAISIAAVKMRNSSKGKQDDGRSSSGNWSASSSTRASVDSDHQQVAGSPVDGVSSPSRNSVGKDSVLSDATQQDQHNRSKDEILIVQSLSNSPSKKKKFGAIHLPWTNDPGSSGKSSTPTPDFASVGSSSTPVVRSPYAGRRGMSDDGDSSVYSVDTDGYYTSMHTDSGLWCSAITSMKLDDVINEDDGFRQRKESQSSVSTIGNSSINSFLSKSATECSSNSGSLKRTPCPQPPPRISSCKTVSVSDRDPLSKRDHEQDDSEKSYSPHHQNGSASASESDHEVRDRIRVKTAITANRYPSMCAVSPETSDDEIAELKNKTLTPNINVIVAEVHREEKPCDASQDIVSEALSKDGETDEELSRKISLINQKQSPNLFSSINMYRSETPVPSNFSSSIPRSQPISTSTPRSGINITTFSPDMSDVTGDSRSSNLELKRSFQEQDKNFEKSEDIVVTEKPTFQTGSDKSLIPLKYAQRITVTPIARSSSSSSVTGTIKRTPLKQNSSDVSVKSEKPASLTYKSDALPSYVSFKAPDSPVSSVPNFIKSTSADRIPTSPRSLPRAVARVTLDPTGKVVYSSNSLGRISTVKTDPEKRTYATLPMCQSHVESRSAPLKREVQNTAISDVNVADVNAQRENSFSPGQISKSTTFPSSPSPKHTQQIASNQNAAFKYNVTNRDFNFRPSRGGRFCRSYFPSHLISPSSSPEVGGNQRGITYKSNYTPVPTHSPQIRNTSTNNYGSSENSAGQNHHATSPQLPTFHNRYIPQSDSSPYAVTTTHSVPNSQSDPAFHHRQNSPTDSGSIWPGRIPTLSSNNYPQNGMQQQFAPNTDSHNFAHLSPKKRILNSNFTPLRPPDLIPSGESPPSTLDITSPASAQKKFSSINRNLNHDSNANFKKPSNEKILSSEEEKSLKSMSATELFAIIHSSKKKHNIKTESEMSMSPLSSRSVSPALSQSSITKLQPVETGVLGKRNEICFGSPDRTKWSDSMPSNPAKKHTAQDKLGLTKPTSMHDFKMLLLQTRTGSQDSSPRPSAAELLKVSPTRSSPVPHSKVPVPSPAYKTPTSHYSSNLNYSPSHGTVPIKRGMRTRSPYLTRYDSAYPPILEDCSEEMESSYEESKCLITSSQPTQVHRIYRVGPESVQRSTPIAKATSTWV